MTAFITLPYAVAKRIWERNPKQRQYWLMKPAWDEAPLRFEFVVEKPPLEYFPPGSIFQLNGEPGCTCTCTFLSEHYGERVRVTTPGCPVHDK